MPDHIAPSTPAATDAPGIPVAPDGPRQRPAGAASMVDQPSDRVRGLLTAQEADWTAPEVALILARLCRAETPGYRMAAVWVAMEQVLPSAVAAEAAQTVLRGLWAGSPVWRPQASDRAAVLVALLGHAYNSAGQDRWAVDGPTASWLLQSVDPGPLPARGNFDLGDAEMSVLRNLAAHARLEGPTLERLQLLAERSPDLQRELEEAGRARELPVELWARQSEHVRLRLARTSLTMDGLARLVSPKPRNAKVLDVLAARADLRPDVREAAVAALGPALASPSTVSAPPGLQAHERHVREAVRALRLLVLPAPIRDAARATVLEALQRPEPEGGTLQRGMGVGDPARARAVTGGAQAVAHLVREAQRVADPETARGLRAEAEGLFAAYRQLSDSTLLTVVPWGRGSPEPEDRTPLVARAWADALGPQTVARQVAMATIYPSVPQLIEQLAVESPATVAAWGPAEWGVFLKHPDRTTRITVLRLMGEHRVPAADVPAADVPAADVAGAPGLDGAGLDEAVAATPPGRGR